MDGGDRGTVHWATCHTVSILPTGQGGAVQSTPEVKSKSL